MSRTKVTINNNKHYINNEILKLIPLFKDVMTGDISGKLVVTTPQEISNDAIELVFSTLVIKTQKNVNSYNINVIINDFKLYIECCYLLDYLCITVDLNFLMLGLKFADVHNYLITTKNVVSLKVLNDDIDAINMNDAKILIKSVILNDKLSNQDKRLYLDSIRIIIDRKLSECATILHMYVMIYGVYTELFDLTYNISCCSSNKSLLIVNDKKVKINKLSIVSDIFYNETLKQVLKN